MPKMIQSSGFPLNMLDNLGKKSNKQTLLFLKLETNYLDW